MAIQRVDNKTLTEKARELIKAQPVAGRRAIAKDLRREYGRALRDSTILALQREIWTRPQTSIETRRAIRMQKEGFLPFETKQLKRMVFSHTEFMIKERRVRLREFNNFVKDLKKQGISKKEALKQWRGNIQSKYQDEGFTLAGGKADPWQYFRDIRAEAIKDGEWKETPRYRGKSHRRLTKTGAHQKIDKGKLKLQRQRYQERQRAKKVKARRN